MKDNFNDYLIHKFNNSNISLDPEKALLIGSESQNKMAFNSLNNFNSNMSQMQKMDLKQTSISKINDLANISNNINSKFLGLKSLDRQTSTKNFGNINQTPEKSEDQLTKELKSLLYELKSKKAAFQDKSRLFCCGCFSVCMIMVIIVFYIFDVMKYQETCNKSKKNYIEICDAPSIGFWPRFVFIAFASVLLIFSLYCTGPTVILFDPVTNKVFIDKKKIFCLPSICEYKLDELLYAHIESDITDGTPNLSNFSFYSVILVFKHDQINLGLGRDCFLINEKIELVRKINKYLEASRTYFAEEKPLLG